MQIKELVGYLDSPDAAADWLREGGLHDAKKAHGNLLRMADSGMTLDLLAIICSQLAKHLPRMSDADMALNNLERFLAASRNPLSLGALLERDLEALPILLQIFSTSQFLSDLLVADPEGYDLLRITEGMPVSRDVLAGELCAEVEHLDDRRLVMATLRRFKRRETLRIAYGDIIRNQPVATVTRQIAFLADAICEAALVSAHRTLHQQRGTPRRADGQPAQFVVLALGKLGGTELNYSSDIDLMFLFDEEGQTDGPRTTSNREYFERLCQVFVKLLGEATSLGSAYRVDLRLRPQGGQGPVVNDRESLLRYYDVYGRTWERQAMVKARPVAGDLELGHALLRQLEPWIYRRYLSRADITGIKALKRRIEQRTLRDGDDTRNVKTGHGGIRDIEFVIQFLQLLNGGDMPQLRTGNTLEAIGRLAENGILTLQEKNILEKNYSFLRTIEHRLQIMFDLQTHTLPDDDSELRKLAIRMGYADAPQANALDAFQNDFAERTAINRTILNHMLHDAFGDADQTEPAVDLVLDPEPSDESIAQTLSPYRFHDVQEAYRNLSALANEPIRFLSTRRCRHFLASIAPRLLEAIAATPDPDATLTSLSKVSDSLGGKGVLWELFSFNRPSLELYVKMCGVSPYLSGILMSNPGMVDDLMDSMMLDRLPDVRSLNETLGDLTRGAEDLEPILHSFKNSQHLRVGVRDILRKDDIKFSHRALSDIAEVALRAVSADQFNRLVEKYGQPTDPEGDPVDLVILAMGKLGGREPNYHSDLDIIFTYEHDGTTERLTGSRRGQTTTNQHFFSELGQRIVKTVNRLGPYGRLYEIDTRLRPTGKSGVLAVSLDELSRYFSEGHGQLWERQALCKARPVVGAERAQQRAVQVVWKAIVGLPWKKEHTAEIRKMRYRLEETASPHNLKRGPGGTVDIEFIVQMLQLRWAVDSPQVLVPGTLDAVDALHDAGYLDDDDRSYFNKAYRFLRGIESGLRLLNTSARHDLPQDQAELHRLAYLLGSPGAKELVEDCGCYTRENRLRFDRIFAAMSHG